MISSRRAFEIAAWALYDFANTIYSLNVLSYHFPLWITSDRGVPEWQFALAVGLSSLAAAALMPAAGALADRTHHKRWPLAAVTAACSVVTAAMGFLNDAWAALAAFAVSHALYQTALVLYNARIVDVGPPGRRGIVSGLGVATGYLGTVTALFLIRPIAAAGGHRAALVPTAACFFLFALPCLLAVRGERRPSSGRVPARPGEWLRLLGASGDLKAFSVFSFFILNAAAIVITLMTVFAKKAALLSEAEIAAMIFASSLSGMAGAVGLGAFYDRRPSAGAVRIVAWLWILTFALNAAFRVKACFFAASVVAGFTLGATWSVTRVYLLSLVPEDRLGLYYGLFGMMGRVAALTGPLAIAALMKLLDAAPAVKYDALNAFLAALALAGMAALRRAGTQSLRPNSGPSV